MTGSCQSKASNGLRGVLLGGDWLRNAPIMIRTPASYAIRAPPVSTEAVGF